MDSDTWGSDDCGLAFDQILEDVVIDDTGVHRDRPTGFIEIRAYHQGEIIREYKGHVLGAEAELPAFGYKPGVGYRCMADGCEEGVGDDPRAVS